jgi:hypothetical protein
MRPCRAGEQLGPKPPGDGRMIWSAARPVASAMWSNARVKPPTPTVDERSSTIRSLQPYLVVRSPEHCLGTWLSKRAS